MLGLSRHHAVFVHRGCGLPPRMPQPTPGVAPPSPQDPGPAGPASPPLGESLAIAAQLSASHRRPAAMVAAGPPGPGLVCRRRPELLLVTSAPAPGGFPPGGDTRGSSQQPDVCPTRSIPRARGGDVRRKVWVAAPSGRTSVPPSPQGLKSRTGKTPKPARASVTTSQWGTRGRNMAYVVVAGVRLLRGGGHRIPDTRPGAPAAAGSRTHVCAWTGTQVPGPASADQATFQAGGVQAQAPQAGLRESVQTSSRVSPL